MPSLRKNPIKNFDISGKLFGLPEYIVQVKEPKELTNTNSRKGMFAINALQKMKDSIDKRRDFLWKETITDAVNSWDGPSRTSHNVPSLLNTETMPSSYQY